MSDVIAAETNPAAFGSPNLYRPSGKVPPASLIIAGMVLIPLGLLFGLIYSAAVVYLPFIKLRFLITCCFGGLLGYVAGSLCYQLKYRSTFLAVLTLLGFTSVAYYTCWAVHPALVASLDGWSDEIIPTLIFGFHPLVIMDWIGWIYVNGIWGMGNGGGLNGVGVVAVWLIEFGLIYGIAFVTGMGTLGNKPFCENCNRWNDVTEDLAVLPVAMDDPAWAQIRSGNFNALKKLQISTEQGGAYVELRLADCPSCDESDYLSAIGITLTMEEGQLKKNETDIFRHLSVSRDQRDEIVAFAEAMSAALEEMSDDEELLESDEQVPPDEAEESEDENAST